MELLTYVRDHAPPGTFAAVELGNEDNIARQGHGVVTPKQAAAAFATLEEVVDEV